MNASNRVIKHLLLIFLCCLHGSLFAHDFWISSDRYRLPNGGKVTLTLNEGVNFKAETLIYLPNWFYDFSLVDLQGRRQIESIPGNDPAADIVLSAEAGSVIGYFSTRNEVKLDAKAFNSYLKEEGLDHILDKRQQRHQSGSKVKEYFSRCAKLLIETDGVGAEDLYSKWLGYPLELTPLNNPYQLKKLERLRVALRFRDRPLANHWVTAYRKEEPTHKIQVETDSHGIATFPPFARGLWLVKAVEMVEVDILESMGGDVEEFDWESFWASLLFEIK